MRDTALQRLPSHTAHRHTHRATEVVGGADIGTTVEAEEVRVRTIRARRTRPIVPVVARVVELIGIIPKPARTGKIIRRI